MRTNATSPRQHVVSSDVPPARGLLQRHAVLEKANRKTRGKSLYSSTSGGRTLVCDCAKKTYSSGETCPLRSKSEASKSAQHSSDSTKPPTVNRVRLTLNGSGIITSMSLPVTLSSCRSCCKKRLMCCRVAVDKDDETGLRRVVDDIINRVIPQKRRVPHRLCLWQVILRICECNSLF